MEKRQEINQEGLNILDEEPEWSIPLFEFDPQKQPPLVDEEAAWWELPDEKVIVVLFHESADEKVAEYYGYQDTLKQFQRRHKEQETQRSESASRQIEEEIVEGKKRQDALLGQLLGG